MTPKLMNFYTTVWFLSVLICLGLEGTFLNDYSQSVINDLSLFTTLNVGGLIPIPAFNLYFFRGVYRILVWDYSFYTGVYQFVRYFWLAVLTPGAVWGIGSIFAQVFASFVKIF